MRIDARVAAWASLHLTRGLPDRALFELLKAFGSPEAVVAASAESLRPIIGIEVAGRVIKGPDPAALHASLDWLAGEERRQLVAWGDPSYPEALLAASDSPAIFYYTGSLDLLARPAVAIVGSRNATPQGLEHAEDFAAALSRQGWTIVSGLALGIDAAAHRGGLAGPGRTLAVVGTGLDRVYPAAHRELAHAIADDGGIVSEFPLNTPPLATNFPRRNRVISGLARGVLVVEATLKSGSLITARLAAEQGREVFAIPGSIHSPFSKGCHRLIKEGAKLVETAQDIVDELAAGEPGKAATQPERSARMELESAQEATLLAALGYDPVGLDALVSRTHLAPDVLNALLVGLELAGRVAALPGGAFQRLP